MTSIITQSFSVNISILKLFGMYPTENRPLLMNMFGYFIFWCMFVPIIFLKFADFCIGGNNETTQLIDKVFLCEATYITFKYFPFLKNGQRIKQCIHYFGDSKFGPRNAKEQAIMDDCIRICRRNTRLFFSDTVAVLLVFVPSFLSHQLPLTLWLPYDPQSKPVLFYATFLYMTPSFLFTLVEAVMNPLISGLAHHATSQLKILKYNLQHLDLNTDPSDFLKRCIDHHESILNFVAEYESCFSLPILCQFAGSMFALCFCCIDLISKPASLNADFLLAPVLGIIVNFQILFYCYYGTLLFEENDGLNTAIYMGQWYTYGTQIRKSLIIIMERSKRPMVVTAAKVVDVTLQTFVSVVKTSYSLIAVFNNYQ